MIMDLSLDHISSIALLDPKHKIRLFVIKLAIKLFLYKIDDRRIIKLIGRLREIFPSVKALEHCREHHCSRCFLVLGRTAAKPTVTLESQGSTVHPAIVFNPPLNKEVVSKNLCYRALFLKMLSALTSSLRETIEKIQCRPVRVECGHVTSHYYFLSA